MNSLTSEKNDLTAQLKGTEDDAKEEYDRVMFDLAEAEKELEDAKKEVNSLTSEKNDLTAQLKGAKDGAKEEYDRVMFDLAEAEKELEDAKKEVNSLTSEKNDLTAQLKGAKDGAKEEYDRVMFDLAEAEKELEDAKKEVNSLTSEKNDLTAQLKGAKDGAKEEYDRVMFDLAEAEKELEDAKKEVNSLTSEKNDLTAQLKGAKDGAKEEYDRVMFDLAEAEKELEDAKKEVNSLTSEKNDLTAQLKGAKDGAKEEYDRVMFDLAEAEKELEDAKKEVNSLTSEKNDLTAQLLNPMTRAAYSGMARPGVLAGIDNPTISPSASSERMTVEYGNDHKPIVKIPTEDEAIELDRSRSVAPVVNEYYGYTFVGTGQSENKHVVLYTDRSKTPEIDDYLTFGVWLTVPEQVADDHSVGAYATGGDPFNGHVPGLTGEPTYEGPAVGIYGKRVAGTGTSDVGSFTADASLTAKFNDGSVSGYVTSFKENGKPLGAWKVKLNFGDSGDNELGPNFGGGTQISKTGNDPDMKGTGAWTGQFYGNGQQPGSVAGTFNTKTGTLDKIMSDDQVDQGFLGIVGAFGAKKVMP